MIGLAALLLDLLTGPYLLFPVLFIIPVVMSAWYGGPRLAYLLAVLLPAGRCLIAIFIDSPGPPLYAIANALIRVAVLGLFAYLVSRTARQTRALQKQVEGFVTMCAWSRTIEYQGRWISFEEYLKRRFDIDVTHGISPEEAERLLSGVVAGETDPPR